MFDLNYQSPHNYARYKSCLPGHFWKNSFHTVMSPHFFGKNEQKKSQFRQNFITNYNKINKLFNRIKEKFERGDMTAFYPLFSP